MGHLLQIGALVGRGMSVCHGGEAPCPAGFLTLAERTLCDLSRRSQHNCSLALPSGWSTDRLAALGAADDPMGDDHGNRRSAVHRTPWDKGKIFGQKVPFKPKNIWAPRVHLQMENRLREPRTVQVGIGRKSRGVRSGRLEGSRRLLRRSGCCSCHGHAAEDVATCSV